MRFPARWARERRAAAPLDPPTISIAGTVLIGETLTATHDGDSVQWLRDGSPISGATSSTYVVTSADVGPLITAQATNAAGSTVSTALVYDDAAHLPYTAIGVSTAGLTTADSGATVQAWAATRGGVSCTLAAPTATQRPAHSASGGAGARPLVTTDGVDDVLTGVITKGSAWDSYEFGVVGSRVSGSLSGERWISYYNAGSIRFGLQSASASAFRSSVAGGTNVNGTTDPDGHVAHYSGDSAGGTQNTRVGGTVEGTASASTTSRADGGEVAIGANAAGTNPANLALQAWHIGPALTDEQRTHLRALLTYLTGITS